MNLYAAKFYIGFGAGGMVAPGEVLTEKQLEALGEKRIAEMLEARQIVALRDESPAPPPPADLTANQEPDAEPEASNNEGAEEETEPEAEEPDNAEELEETEELEELNSTDDIVAEDTPEEAETPKPTAEKPKNTAGRKGKKDK